MFVKSTYVTYEISPVAVTRPLKVTKWCCEARPASITKVSTTNELKVLFLFPFQPRRRRKKTKTTWQTSRPGRLTKLAHPASEPASLSCLSLCYQAGPRRLERRRGLWAAELAAGMLLCLKAFVPTSNRTPTWKYALVHILTGWEPKLFSALCSSKNLCSSCSLLCLNRAQSIYHALINCGYLHQNLSFWGEQHEWLMDKTLRS